ncbi:MAG: T9SS type A sorting domain-containing protein [Bacteroidia bacterium]|nr:T9SS type A sorting domain-containing protein [Bacteroidia bacterium]
MKHKLLFLIILSISTLLQAQPSWNSLGSGIVGNNLKIYSMSAPDEQTLWAVPRNFLGTPLPTFTKSINGGSSWTPDTIDAVLNTELTPVQVFALNADVAWIVTERIDTRDSAVIFKTTDGGTTWSNTTGGFSTDSTGLKALHFWNANQGFAFGSAGNDINSQNNTLIYTTDDGGANWTQVASTPANEGSWTPSGTQGYAVVGDILWFGTTDGNVWKSTDRGQSWSSSSTGLGQSISSVAFKDANNGVCVVESRIGAYTNDGGTTWTAIPNFSASIGALAPTNVLYIPKTEDTYIAFNAPFNNADIAYSNDGGQTWATFNGLLSMESMVFFDLTIGFGGGTISNASQGGIYEWTGNIPGAVNNEATFASFNAPRIFPNPVRQYLNIEMQTQGAWSFDIYALHGQKVFSQASISQLSNSIDLGNLPSGTYLLKVSQGEKSLTHKIVKQ